MAGELGFCLEGVGVGSFGLSVEQQDYVWARWRAGESLRAVAAVVSPRRRASVTEFVKSTGGVRRPMPRRRAGHLSVLEREEISRGIAAGQGVRGLARRLGRSASTVSREISRNGGVRHYRASRAEAAARVRARRPKPAKLAVAPVLRAVVEDRLGRGWSPQQISARLVMDFPHDPGMRVSHETIYLSLFVQSRGALRRDLQRQLRTGRAMRHPRAARLPQGRGQLRDTLHIRERPAEAEDRAVPGHWEGDLVMGRRPSAVGTLVERHSRFVQLFALPDGWRADQVRPALTTSITRLPDQLRRSLTWDQGKEMAQHAQFSIDTGLAVYFCDPRSPWQRGSNENTNGLLRQYLAKSADLRQHTQSDLDQIAALLNNRPRRTLHWRTPAEKLNETVALTP